MEDVKDAARVLLEKVTAHLAGIPAEELSPQAAKQTSSALKDIRDLLTCSDDGEGGVIKVVLADALQELAE